MRLWRTRRSARLRKRLCDLSNPFPRALLEPENWLANSLPAPLAEPSTRGSLDDERLTNEPVLSGTRPSISTAPVCSRFARAVGESERGDVALHARGPGRRCFVVSARGISGGSQSGHPRRRASPRCCLNVRPHQRQVRLTRSRRSSGLSLTTSYPCCEPRSLLNLLLRVVFLPRRLCFVRSQEVVASTIHGVVEIHHRGRLPALLDGNHECGSEAGEEAASPRKMSSRIM